MPILFFKNNQESLKNKINDKEICKAIILWYLNRLYFKLLHIISYNDLLKHKTYFETKIKKYTQWSIMNAEHNGANGASHTIHKQTRSNEMKFMEYIL